MACQARVDGCDTVPAGDFLTEGSANPQDILLSAHKAQPFEITVRIGGR